MAFQQTIVVSTSGHKHIQDLTSKVEHLVRESEIRTGIAHVFNIGSTASIGIIEFEPGLCLDLPQFLDRLIPASREYGHEQTWHDGNGHSHLQSTLLGHSVNVPVRDGKLALGNWQQIVHLECDIRARKREVVVTVVGE